MQSLLLADWLANVASILLDWIACCVSFAAGAWWASRPMDQEIDL